jgi:hypothetical protein
MATYRYVAYNIQTAYKKTYDDSDLTLNQIIFWINVVVNRLRKENEKDFEEGKHLATFCKVPVKISDCKKRKYIDLPVDIADLENHKGVQYITYNYESGCCCSGANFAQVFFQPTSPMKSFRLMGDEYEKPKPDNPYFYRVTGEEGCNNVDKLYFLGLECIDITDVEIGVICSVDASSVCDLDEEIPIQDWLIEDLITRVLNLGRFLLITPQEMINEGSDLTNRSAQSTPSVQQPPATLGQIAAARNQQAENTQQIQNLMSNGQ